MTWWRSAFEAACEHLDARAVRLPDGANAPAWHSSDPVESLFPEQGLYYRGPDGSLWLYGFHDLTNTLRAFPGRLGSVPALVVEPMNTDAWSLLLVPFRIFGLSLASDLRYLAAAARLDRERFDRAVMVRTMGGAAAVRAYLDASGANPVA